MATKPSTYVYTHLIQQRCYAVALNNFKDTWHHAFLTTTGCNHNSINVVGLFFELKKIKQQTNKNKKNPIFY